MYSDLIQFHFNWRMQSHLIVQSAKSYEKSAASVPFPHVNAKLRPSFIYSTFHTVDGHESYGSLANAIEIVQPNTEEQKFMQSFVEARSGKEDYKQVYLSS